MLEKYLVKLNESKKQIVLLLNFIYELDNKLNFITKILIKTVNKKIKGK